MIDNLSELKLLVPTSKLRTAIVELFPDTDIGMTRMMQLDTICRNALCKAMFPQREKGS